MPVLALFAARMTNVEAVRAMTSAANTTLDWNAFKAVVRNVTH